MNTTLQSFAAKLSALAAPAAPVGGSKNINSQALFAALLNNELRRQAGPEAHAQADHVVAQYFKAVLLCRASKLPEALARLQASDALMLTLPALTVDFVTLFQLSAWGNYHYKTGESHTAIDLLRQGLGISAGLERQGYGALVYRRFEQLQNIANILLKACQADEAHQLLKNALVYAHSGHASGLLIDDWEPAAVGRVPVLQDSTLEALFSQLASQNTATMGQPGYDHAYYYAFCQDLLRDLTTDTYNRTVLYNWMYVKASWFEQGPDAFLANVLEFIIDPEISASYDVFKGNLLAQSLSIFRPQPADSRLVDTVKHFAETRLTDRYGKAIRLAA